MRAGPGTRSRFNGRFGPIGRDDDGHHAPAPLKRLFDFTPDARPTGFPHRFLTQSYIDPPHLRQWRTLIHAPPPNIA